MANTSQSDRERFRRIVAKSNLPIAIFAEWVLGRDPCTAFRYLSDGEMPESVVQWLRHLVRVEHNGDEVTIVMKWGEANPRWWPHVEHGASRTFMTERRGVEKSETAPKFMRHKYRS